MSRELNERVAVEVMGWEWSTELYSKPWLPSARLDHAFVVVEMMLAQGFGAIITAPPNQGRHNWIVSFVRSGESAVGRTQENPSLPTAICQAALAAKGGK